MTPEGLIKKKINKYLSTLQTPFSGIYLHYRMPVLTGYGQPALDFEGCINGLYFCIETKAPGEWLTPRQRQTALNIVGARGKVFIISSDEGLEAFRRWVSSLR
jgi:hypothetical protein